MVAVHHVRSIVKKNKFLIFLLSACSICFIILPLVCINTSRQEENMLVFLFQMVIWPAAGAGLAFFATLKVKKKKEGMVLPGMTIAGILLTHVFCPSVSILTILHCLLFEAAGYGMVYFWGKI